MTPRTLSLIALCFSLISFGLWLWKAFFPTWPEKPIIENELVAWAEDLYPLDEKRTYILKKNTPIYFGESEIFIPAESFYVILIPGESDQETQQANSGRKIGSTAVDLTPYEGKEVTLRGYHYLGQPMFLRSPLEVPMFARSHDQAVIHIEALRSREDEEQHEQFLKDLNSRPSP